MTSIPLWLRALRMYCHHSPLARGKYKMVLRAYQQLPIPDVEVVALLDDRLQVQLRLRFWVDFNIYCIGLYEQYLAAFFKRQLKPDTVFLDVGAYIGQYALLAAQHAPSGVAYAFEPVSDSANRLRWSVQANRFANLEVVERAVGEGTKPATFYLSSEPSMSSLLGPHTAFDQVVTVPSTTLDMFCAEHNLQDIDIIKIDAEEAEAQIIRGAIETLRRCTPLLIMELSMKQRSETINLLESLDYKLFTLNRSHLVALTKELTEVENVIAIPSCSLERRNLSGINP